MKQQTPSEWAIAMLGLMSPTLRRRLLRKIAPRLRKQTAARIRSQTAPDGTAWEPRKPQRKRKSQRRRVKMLIGFAKATHLKLVTSSDVIELGYRRGAARLAQIHHYGLIDNVSKNSTAKVQYPARPLLGLADADIEQFDADIGAHFSDSANV